MKYLKMMSVLILALTMVNCSDDDIPPPVADFTADVNGTEVTFTSTMSNVKTFEWNFDDGNSSTEANPIHAYEKPGVYKVTLNLTGKDGSISAVVKDVEVMESMNYLLTGGAARPEGKIWRLSYEVSDPVGKEGVGAVTNDLTILIPDDTDGTLEWVGLGNAYDDEFTFVFDESYSIDNADGQSVMSLLYANISHQGDIVKPSEQPELVPFADVTYSPVNGEWSFQPDAFTIDALNLATGTIDPVTFTGKTQLIVSDYLGFKDATSTIIIKSISETEMNIAIALHGAKAAHEYPSHMFHMTLKAVPFAEPK